MKECPRCKTKYKDNLLFCLQDGTPLSGRDDPEATLVVPVATISPADARNIARKYAALVKDKTVFFQPRIPQEKPYAAYASFAQQALLANENPLCLYTDKSNGRDGCLITTTRIHFKKPLLSPEQIPFSQVKSIKPTGNWLTLRGILINGSTKIDWYGSRNDLELICLMLLELIRPGLAATN